MFNTIRLVNRNRKPDFSRIRPSGGSVLHVKRSVFARGIILYFCTNALKLILIVLLTIMWISGNSVISKSQILPDLVKMVLRMVNGTINIGFRALTQKVPLAKTNVLVCDTCRYVVRPYHVAYQKIRLCKAINYFKYQIILKHV